MAVEPVRRQYDSVVYQLLSRVPDFRAARIMLDDDLPYVVFEEFAAFLRDGLRAGTLTSSTVDQAFRLLNELAASHEDEVVNLVAVAVLEVLAEDDLVLATARRLLVGEAKNLLEDVVARQKPP